MSSYLQVVLLLSTLCSVHANYNGTGWWMRQPYEEESDFNEKAEYGANLVLHCAGNFTVDFWVIPDMSVIDATNDFVRYFTIDGYSYTRWIDKGDSLNISLVVEDQFGFYFCHGTDAKGTRMVVKKALNYKGPYFADLWEVYEMNVIVACSSAGAFLIIVIVSYCVYEFKCSDKDEDEPEENGHMQVPYHINSGYDGDSAPKVIPASASAIPMESTTF